MSITQAFGLVGVLLVLVSTVAVAPTAAAVTDGERAGDATDDGVAEDPWRVTNDVTVYRNGTARVVLTTNRSVEVVQLAKRNVNGLEFLEGSEAVTNDENRVVWEPTVADRVVYRVELGNAPRYGSAVLEEAVLFRTSEILSAKYWRGNLPAPERRLALDAPNGWTEAAPGERVGPNEYALRPSTRDDTFLREMVAVGDFEVQTWTTGDDTIRYAAFPNAVAPPAADLREVLTGTMPVLEEYTGADPEYPFLVMTVPESVENGGVARDHSFIVQGNTPVFNLDGRSTYVHELTHLYQRNWGVQGQDWLSEGMAMYYQHLALYEAGLVTAEEFRRMVRVYTTDETGESGRTVGEPIRTTAGQQKYAKGEAVFAALDVAVRAETDGESDVGDVVAGFNEQTFDSEDNFYVTRSEFLAAIENVTDSSYEDFYANYVESPAYPDVLLSEDYSLADPPSVDSGLPPAATLAARNDELRERIEAQNATVQSLRDRLAARNGTVEDLQDELASLEDELASLEDELADREETVRALRDRLADRNETVAGLSDRLADRNETVRALRDRLADRNETVEALRERLADRNETVEALRNESAASTATASPSDTTPGESDAATDTGGAGDLRAVGLLLGLTAVFALGIRVGRRS